MEVLLLVIVRLSLCLTRLTFQTPIPASLLKLPTDQMNKIATDCFRSIMQFMGDLELEDASAEIDCAFKVLKVSWLIEEILLK